MEETTPPTWPHILQSATQKTLRFRSSRRKSGLVKLRSCPAPGKAQGPGPDGAGWRGHAGTDSLSYGATNPIGHRQTKRPIHDQIQFTQAESPNEISLVKQLLLEPVSDSAVPEPLGPMFQDSGRNWHKFGL